MQANDCVGCKTYFEQGQVLPPQSLTIQFKNYDLPIKQGKQKWILLKTIVAFLNSKGGTIYIGIQDSDGKVHGCQTSRKQQDQFKLFIKSLVEKIVPTVDLMDKQQIEIMFLPVTKNKKFTGRYVTKIVVKQGDPSKLYCFAQRLVLQSYDKKEAKQQFQVVHTFRRHNMGGVQQAKGMKLVQCAQKKAAKPNAIADTFHEDCNPDPLKLQIQITKIAFGGLQHKKLAQKLKKMFQSQMQNFEMKYNLIYDVDQKVLVLELENKKDFEEVDAFIKKNLNVLNEQEEDVQFVYQGVKLDFNLYQNIKASKKQSLNKSKKEQKKKQQQKYNPLQDSTLSQSEITQAEKPSFQDKNPAYSLTFTHINPIPKVRGDFLKYLEKIGQNKFDFAQKIYQNTIELYFKQKQKQQQFFYLCQSKKNELLPFGFNNQIFWGYPTGSLHILNYDKNKRKDFENFIKTLIGQQLKSTQYKKENNKYFLDVKMKQKSGAAKWLDQLLVNKQIKTFSNPGAQQGKAPKMKVVLHCLGQGQK